MKYQLIKETHKNYSPLQQILYNRGISLEDSFHYINTTDDDINSPLAFDENKLKQASNLLLKAITKGWRCSVLVDSDCDGFCSSALLINYLYKMFPDWADICLDYYIHDEKQHGLSDCWEVFIPNSYFQPSLLICPDAASNDTIYHKKLKEKGIDIICLDHHEYIHEETPAIIINSQDEYPNKAACGGAVTWQFCRYLDMLQNTNQANEYLDLVALSLTADMMSLLSLETKHLINKGFETKNIKNPFIYHMWQKNHFKLGEQITSWGAAFYIAPFINAIVRSGDYSEKEIVFRSMLTHEANELILSNKRGHKVGEEEPLVEQAMRVCTNVKNRQTKDVDKGMALLEQQIEENHMMDNQVLLFLIKPGQIDKNIAGLCGNKIMAKYQRPCCVLTECIDKEGNISYQGSARGCDIVNVTNFKDICAETGCTLFEAG